MPTAAQGRLIREWGRNYPGLPTPDFTFVNRYWHYTTPWEPESYTPQGLASDVVSAMRFLSYAADHMRQFSPVRCPDCGGQGMERNPFADSAHAWHCTYDDGYWTDGEILRHRRAYGFTVMSLMTQIGFGGSNWSYSRSAADLRHTAAQKLPEVMARYAEPEGRPLPDDTVFLTVEIFAHYVERDGGDQTYRICRDILSVFTNRRLNTEQALNEYARISRSYRETATPVVPETELIAE